MVSNEIVCAKDGSLMCKQLTVAVRTTKVIYRVMYLGGRSKRPSLESTKITFTLS